MNTGRKQLETKYTTTLVDNNIMIIKIEVITSKTIMEFLDESLVSCAHIREKKLLNYEHT